MTGRPPVRVNQVGYLPRSVKRATLVSQATEPLELAVGTAAGEPLWRGRSQPRPRRPDLCIRWNAPLVHVAARLDASASDHVPAG